MPLMNETTVEKKTNYTQIHLMKDLQLGGQLRFPCNKFQLARVQTLRYQFGTTYPVIDWNVL